MEALRNDISALKEKMLASPKISNNDRRKLHVENELLEIRLEDHFKKVVNEDPVLNTLKDDINLIRMSVRLEYDNRVINFGDILFEIIRVVAVWGFLVYTATIFAVPCILIKQLENVCHRVKIITTSKYRLSVICKRMIAKVILLASGISVISNQYDQDNDCKQSGSIICFSHSSTMDAFLISSVIPVRNYTLAKSDLFLIPYFSWLLVAFDALPIDRKNRNNAIKSIGLAVQSAIALGDCIAVAPEGTRSTSGQLTAFKKGPFYMSEQLKIPLVPLVIFGAYELYPPGRQMSIPGRVYCKFLKPIQPSEASTRDEMSRLLRIRMLEAYRDCPSDVCAKLTAQESFYNILTITIILIVLAATGWVVGSALSLRYSWGEIALYWLGGTAAITLGLYVYMVYLRVMGG